MPQAVPVRSLWLLWLGISYVRLGPGPGPGLEQLGLELAPRLLMKIFKLLQA